MALVIAGERSGVGKTTVTLALLSSLSRKSGKVQSFKVGPDYIDPMFHTAVTGNPCRNLDPVLTSEEYVQECFFSHIQSADYALIEGVMGLFDGASGKNDFASTAHIARLLELPVLLVLDCSRLSRSVAAIAKGYISFDPRVKIAGLVLNKVGSNRHLQLLQDALNPLEIPILGVLRREDNITIPDRHLGLVPTEELNQMDILIDRLGELGDRSFDWAVLLDWLRVEGKEFFVNAKGAKEDAKVRKGFLGRFIATSHSPLPSRHSPFPIKIAVARDRAFSFYYQDNLDILQDLGAELVFWSPLSDSRLPADVCGLYFGGGFPEVFAPKLAENIEARSSVRQAILQGIPTYAECGGLMYLCEKIIDFEDKSWLMVGIFPTTAVMGKRLTLGYRQATVLQESPILSVGARVWGHEFHRSHLTVMPKNTLFEIQGYEDRKQDIIGREGWTINQVHASYLHLHWGATPEIPNRFLKLCQEFR
ncbi:MAG TPA: cobyrinic acid a,c-diamide synthase [Cyanobacteria bacterium UBA11149]|nr:cobyrinic acid a,c-diamide synthase [Cyanobacteria bacterium UBA11367]HBE60363.1 cobyrinic acid a,c-diamide synthase [Cyanobacteria bacterium UBA11366]HBK62015.1 cobyrinic acid a,c-diamide synthase [Cyanobacteria bacterium UBA11166]HBR74589.1 cobyrinic acid a,c-diamide synthase [Cyanobacteria bacterium UBA11159]HBS71591.1 cobyrinic acid a,c-diamide synthase [Cyanobacteria bacterium UBA11153]HBW91282.1 cobyrinic acid a,c-diamide synthase [Cyanobacteria bacterium UBA11149]HCA95384.1 cobyrini